MNVAKASFSHTPFHQRIVTRSPNHMWASSCSMTSAMRSHLGPRRVGGVGEELGLAEGDAAEVLHRARREVRDRDEVELVAGIREREVLAVVAQRVRRDLDRERREVALARRVTTRKAMPSTSTGSVATRGPTTKATR